jgi:hypothetical protein
VAAPPIRAGKDAFDGAVCLRLACSRKTDEVLWSRGECWKDLGIPEQVQLDNARELAGEREVQKALRASLLKHKLHKDQDLFDRAYAYIKQYY